MLMMMNAHEITKSFPEEEGRLEVIKGASFHVEKGEMVALIGVSGAGKTTLLQILGGLDTATSGSIEVEGKDLRRMSPKELAYFRNRSIGFVFQFHHLMPDFDAVENVLMPGLIAGRNTNECEPRARELLDAVGLSGRMRHYPSELSGGERQRVALARAMFNDPAIVLADEPTGNLDSSNSAHLLELFRRANRERNQTFVVASHNEHLTAGMSRTIHIEDGRVRAADRAGEEAGSHGGKGEDYRHEAM